MFERRLSYEETLKLIERGVLCESNVHICIDKLSKHSTDEYYINKIEIEESATKKEILFDVIKCDEAVTNNREPVWIPYNWIKEISNMPIECLLEAYDMVESNRIVEVYLETDIEKDIIGKEEAELEGYELYDGLKFIFYKDKNEKYCGKTLTVKGVGESIRFVANRGRPRKKRN
jgi:hypothetical protein